MTKKEMDNNNKNISPKKRNKMKKKRSIKSDSEPEIEEYDTDEEYALKNQDGTFSLRFPRFKTFRSFEVGEKI